MDLSPLGDYVPAPNQAGNPSLYELENQAIDHEGTLWAALCATADPAGKDVVDLGCGSGFWLRQYAAAARFVIGVEPDPDLLQLARQRVLREGAPHLEVLRGSAEHLPLPDASVDVVHARFAYFFPTPRQDCAPGLHEAMRVLRPGGALVVIDNDQLNGDFAALLRASDSAQHFQGTGGYVRDWWGAQGAVTREVMSSWSFESTTDRDAVLRLEFPDAVAAPYISAHPAGTRMSYGYLLHSVAKMASPSSIQPLP